jgi:hypothetical protein
VVVAAAVVANAGEPPELVHKKCTANHIGVVHFMVVANPGADQAPGSFYSGVGSEASNLLGLAA